MTLCLSNVDFGTFVKEAPCVHLGTLFVSVQLSLLIIVYHLVSLFNKINIFYFVSSMAWIHTGAKWFGVVRVPGTRSGCCNFSAGKSQCNSNTDFAVPPPPHHRYSTVCILHGAEVIIFLSISDINLRLKQADWLNLSIRSVSTNQHARVRVLRKVL